jgi:hypothetical protein
MAGPSWLADTFAGIMIVTAAYCVSRLVISQRRHRPTELHVDAMHVLMGVAMAGMLVPRLRVFWTGGWEIVFGVGAAWFAWHAVREFRGQETASRWPRHHLQHVLACGAMLYMFLAVTSDAKAVSGGSSMGGMAGGGAHFRTLALVLAFALLGYVVWTADRLSSLAPVAVLAARSAQVPAVTGAGAGTAPAATGIKAGHGDVRDEGQAPSTRCSGAPVSPRLAACCEIAMGVTMGYMLILML